MNSTSPVLQAGECNSTLLPIFFFLRVTDNTQGPYLPLYERCISCVRGRVTGGVPITMPFWKESIQRIVCFISSLPLTDCLPLHCNVPYFSIFHGCFKPNCCSELQQVCLHASNTLRALLKKTLL